MTAAKTPTVDVFRVAPDINAEIARWLRHLGAERRMSAKTLDAYRRDVSQFLSFLADHLGSAPTLKQLAKLIPADIRAFMAARRNEGAGNRSLMRTLAGCRSFARFLERNGKGKVAALAAVRTPKLPRTLPKPLAISAAKKIADTDLREGEEREPWIIARDAAVRLRAFGNYAYRIAGDREDARDIAQEAFVKVFEALPGMVGRDVDFSRYLYRTAHNLAIDLVRGRSKVASPEPRALDRDQAVVADLLAGDRATSLDLGKARDRAHILVGLLIAVAASALGGEKRTQYSVRPRPRATAPSPGGGLVTARGGDGVRPWMAAACSFAMGPPPRWPSRVRVVPGTRG